MQDDSSSERELAYDVPSWLQDLLELAGMTGEAMFDTELWMKDADMFEEATDRRREFKALLRRLYFWYEPKFEHVESVELGEDLEDKLDTAQDVWQLEFQEARELFQTIRDLMEAIGHTQFETEKHSDMGV